ncbi:MAG: patatin-like phospholipase family protein, partial [Planctomycetota bacterium JB042]
IFDILFGADSLLDTDPLHRLVAEVITEETLERVAAPAADHRLLAVGTTNVDYDQTWVWNMSAIAVAGDLDLYRKVLLASSAFPIVFPPVEIDGHLFVDGAARSNLVIPGLSGEHRPGPPLFGPGNLYIIDNGKLENPPEALRRALGDVAATTVSVMMNQSMQTAMLRSFVGTMVVGYDFKYVGIPTGVDIGKNPLAFDPTQMRDAFDAGRALARQPSPWSDTPPPTDDLPAWAAELIHTPR